MRCYSQIREFLCQTLCMSSLIFASLASVSCSSNDASGVDGRKLSDLNLEESRQFCRDSSPDIGTTFRAGCQFQTAQAAADGDLSLAQCKQEWESCTEFEGEGAVDCDQIMEEDVGNDCDVTVGEFLDCFAKWAELWSDIAKPVSCEKAVDGIDASTLKKAKEAENPKFCEKVIKECLTDTGRYSVSKNFF